MRIARISKTWYIETMKTEPRKKAVPDALRPSDTGSILIVEDEVIVAENLRSSLVRHGYTVAGISCTGADAILKTRDLSPTLILMDIMLKGNIDGIETAEKIHETTDIPVVFLTSRTDEETLKRARRVSPLGYIIKPFEDRQLRITLDMVLNRIRMENERKKLMEEIDLLRGFIPICSQCKKIRDDDGYWEQVEAYMARHWDAKFTHGICPDCAKQLYPEQFKEKK